MKKLIGFLALAAITTMIVSHPLEAAYKSKQYGSMQKQMKSNNQEDIATIAMNNKDLSTLVTALEAADLVSVLQGAGPYTVFAPTNAAFAQLGTSLDELLKPENKEQLRTILLLHVVPEKLNSDKIHGDMELTTVSGDPIGVQNVNGQIKVKGAHVMGKEIKASNGVVFVIDKVITP